VSSGRGCASWNRNLSWIAVLVPPYHTGWERVRGGVGENGKRGVARTTSNTFPDCLGIRTGWRLGSWLLMGVGGRELGIRSPRMVGFMTALYIVFNRSSLVCPHSPSIPAPFWWLIANIDCRSLHSRPQLFEHVLCSGRRLGKSSTFLCPVMTNVSKKPKLQANLLCCSCLARAVSKCWQ